MADGLVTTTSQRPILVIGYGNTLRGDDGLGPHIAQEIARRNYPGVRALAVTQLTVELSADLALVQTVVFVDARLEGTEPVQLEAILPGAAAAPFSHSMSPQALLAATKALFDHVPAAWWLTVAGTCFSLTDGLSEVARQNAARALRLIE